MKKSIFLVAAIALTFVACQPNGEVEDQFLATFEEAAISPAAVESEYSFNEDKSDYLISGDFKFRQTVAYSGAYVTGAVVSNRTDVNVAGVQDANKSIAGGAKAGHNYVVWYYDGYNIDNPDDIIINTPAVIPGMYVTNTAWVVKCIKEGDGMSYVPGGFQYEDYLLLTIYGWRNGVVKGSVDYFLASGGKYTTAWEYVDLSSLGVVDRLTFTMEGSKINDYGLTTPTYFCIDNFGAKR